MSHFVVVETGSYEPSTIFGVYDTLERAILETESRTATVEQIHAQSRANRERLKTGGDPGPYVPAGEEGIGGTQIEEWEGSQGVRCWIRGIGGKWKMYDGIY